MVGNLQNLRDDTSASVSRGPRTLTRQLAKRYRLITLYSEDAMAKVVRSKAAKAYKPPRKKRKG